MPPGQLDSPTSDEDLYLTVGDDILATRPVSQGDVFDGITLPGFPTGHHDSILLVTHPCSLRAGPHLKARVQAAPVTRGQHLPPARWPSAFQRHLPLPGLPKGDFMAALTETGIVTPEQLEASRRVAVLSEHGTLLLQQRLVWSLTHAVIGLDTLEEYSAPAFAEIELLEEWNEQLCAGLEGDDLARQIVAEAVEFERYIRSDTDIQERLQVPSTRGDARRLARDEIRRRAAARGAVSEPS